MAGKYVFRPNVKNFAVCVPGHDLFDLGGCALSNGHAIPIGRLTDNPLPFVVREEVEGDYLLPSFDPDKMTVRGPVFPTRRKER